MYENPGGHAPCPQLPTPMIVCTTDTEIYIAYGKSEFWDWLGVLSLRLCFDLTP